MAFVLCVRAVQWRVLWLPPTENSSQRYFSALLGTPARCLEHVRNQFLQVNSTSVHGKQFHHQTFVTDTSCCGHVEPFVQVVERHSLRVYTEWSLLESDLRELIHLLHSSLHAHLDSHDGDDVSALIPPLVRCADEALLPLPPHEANAYVDAAATMQRVAAEERLASQWRQQCPAAAGQVMAAIILIIDTVKIQNHVTASLSMCSKTVCCVAQPFPCFVLTIPDAAFQSDVD